MDSSKLSTTTTPRRSQRLKSRDPTPSPERQEVKTPGPRALAKMRRAQKIQDLNKTEPAAVPEEKEVPKRSMSRASMPGVTEPKISTPAPTVKTEEKSASKRRGRPTKKSASSESDEPSHPTSSTINASTDAENTTIIENNATIEEKLSKSETPKKEDVAPVEPMHVDDLPTEAPEAPMEIAEVQKVAIPVPDDSKKDEVAQKIFVFEASQSASEVEKSATPAPAAKKSVPPVSEPEKQAQPALKDEKSAQPAPSQEEKPAQPTTKKVKSAPATEKSVQPAPKEEKPVQPVTEEEIADISEIVDSAPAATADLNTTPNLMDESIVLITESPLAPIKPKDSTFSPVVDTSIQDSRPNIDSILNMTPSAPLPKIAHRTSTPLVQKVLNMEAANSSSVKKNLKLSVPAASALAKPREEDVQEEFEEEEETRTINPMEKSILKSSRRKRSLSVADAESFAQKRVMFISPQIMEIEAIDEKMMASFIEEKESSMIRQAVSSARRKRSMSLSTPKERQVKIKKMPDFKAIHQQQFEKMESIADHANRKLERAKKMRTPPPTKPIKPEVKSKIPTTINSRKPLIATSDNVIKTPHRALKRSLSAPDGSASKRIQLENKSDATKKVAVVNGMQRTKSETATWRPPAATTSASFIPTMRKPAAAAAPTQSVAQMNRAKIEERRERNMSLYKTNQVQRSTAESRQKSSEALRGVRLNRRFELQMKHRRELEEHKDV